MRAKKSLGQHFLTSESAITAIIAAAKLNKSDSVLEIGPGKGVLTKALLKHAGKVVAIEKDPDMIAYLTEEFANELKNGSLTLYEGSAEDIAFDAVLPGEYKVVANIPYYITGLLLRHMFSQKTLPTCAVVLVQKEVATRIAREKKESILSLSVKVYGTPVYIQTVKAGSFSPAPKVDSAILAVYDIQRSAVDSPNKEKVFFTLLKEGFSKKRKLLVSNLSHLLPREEILSAFTDAGISHSARAEDVPLSQWLAITPTLERLIHSNTTK
jgi:16S rRNA (adenine1518-N6/adenine1519-N6)-dimethyltransferase